SSIMGQNPLVLGFESSNFLRENMARQLMEKIPIFTAGTSWEEWSREVISKIPSEWPLENKINAIKGKMDTLFQSKIQWAMEYEPFLNWPFLEKMRIMTSPHLNEAHRQNALRDMRQMPGQMFGSWLATVTYHIFSGEGGGAVRGGNKKNDY